MTTPNERAFPVSGAERPHQLGLTNREYFAAIALQGLMGNSEPEMIKRSGSYAQLAVQAADELIAELNKPQS